MLPVSIVLITAALVAYTTGVWAEHHHGSLRWWHVVAFFVGLACDAAGTGFMAAIAAAGTTTNVSRNPGLASVMSVTGTVAIALMAVHAVWAVVTMLRGSDQARRRFHRFSLVVWAIWLVPYVTGMLSAML